MQKKTNSPAGTKVHVILKKSDFDMDKSGRESTPLNYTEPDDCPLARAVKRHFKVKDVLVDGADFGVSIEGLHWLNRGEWGSGIASIVGANLHAGDKTQYYVTLTKA
jgi:hypothetical protein